MKSIQKYKNPILEGNIWQQLLVFFFPILLASLFQQLYNAADAVVVGRYVSKEALSAVGGTSAAVIQMINGIFVGLSAGATVIVSQYYGAKEDKGVSEAVHTAFTFSIVSGLVMMVVGIIYAPNMLEAMSTPADVMNESVTYLRIYFLGMVGNLVYNMGAGILRAVGDTKRPLYFLIFTCGLNIILDLFFILGIGMGVEGAGYATIISQTLSAIMIVALLLRSKENYKVYIKSFKIHINVLAKIIKIGVPAAIQSVMYTGANILTQKSINGLSTNAIAAWAAYSKIDGLYWMIMGAFGISITTFVGQNYGAGKFDRINESVKKCAVMSVGVSIIVSILIYVFGDICLMLFTPDMEVVAIGMEIIHLIVPFYISYVGIEILSGALRGIGNVWVPMILCAFGVCAIRVVWNLVIVPIKPELSVIIFTFPLTWVITTVLFLVYILWKKPFKIGK